LGAASFGASFFASAFGTGVAAVGAAVGTGIVAGATTGGVGAGAATIGVGAAGAAGAPATPEDSGAMTVTEVTSVEAGAGAPAGQVEPPQLRSSRHKAVRMLFICCTFNRLCDAHFGQGR